MYEDQNNSGMSQHHLHHPSTHWNRFEDKLFEQALVMFPDDSSDRWQKIATQLPGKSPTDVREHYEALVHDVYEIDSGRVELPSYVDESDWDSPSQISFGPKHKQSETERKKGTPWTEDEHKLFLIGLRTYGKGDWRSISRNVVVTRTPTQVASHAQKYFLRQSSVRKERKRSSIHDITTVDNNSSAQPSDQNWIPPPEGPPPIHQQPPAAVQQFTPTQQYAGQGGIMGYQNYGFHM